ncbi:N-acetylglucosamine kinase [Paraflavitalea soli]|uniref:N-acetylglucosamine kinase n=1 Tax=Paraflavitalea soli TaxID=2315862 RepID=A0A3B7MYE8_9BACT|nr:N-acetylglucosamine kinase [Paraflavitalea soli]AXY78249.1 N-acetylglucosamine kinase [Paraflavitalea soli]
MILIADSGSTKTTWSLLSGQDEIMTFQTEGYNPYYVTGEYIIESLHRSLPQGIAPASIRQLFFYGAGCEEDRIEIMNRSLASVFYNAEVFVFMDLLAAARGLLGNQPGFVSILGTGSNTCIYDGEKIVHHIDSLGFILGDEGSASYLGKKLLQDYLRGTMPAAVMARFDNKYGISREEIFFNVYTQPLANRYCAGFCKFLQLDCDYSRKCILDGFRQFFQNLVSLYPHYASYSFNCSGTVGFVFRELLEEVAAEFGMRTNKVLTGPIEGLVAFHSQ